MADLQKLDLTQPTQPQTQPQQTITATNENGEERKSFTFRNIPPDLHKSWKICAALSGLNMEEFGLKGIQEKIEKISREAALQQQS
jgi:hypothetical protein